jgi:hypothetical protein
VHALPLQEYTFSARFSLMARLCILCTLLTGGAAPCGRCRYQRDLAAGGRLVEGVNCSVAWLWEGTREGVPEGASGTEVGMGGYVVRDSVMEAFTQHNPRPCLREDGASPPATRPPTTKPPMAFQMSSRSNPAVNAHADVLVSCWHVVCVCSSRWYLAGISLVSRWYLVGISLARRVCACADAEALSVLYPDCSPGSLSTNVCVQVEHNIGIVRIMMCAALTAPPHNNRI